MALPRQQLACCWGLVTPEEIERVDVMYGPFSAVTWATSAGAVVDYVTRMPDKLEAHVAAGYARQSADVLAAVHYRSWNTSASIGSRSGDWSYWINLSRSDSQGPAHDLPHRAAVRRRAGGAGTPVTGAIAGLNTTNQPWYILRGHAVPHQAGSRQDQAGLRHHAHAARQLHAAGGRTAPEAARRPICAWAGRPAGSSGNINIDGKTYKLADTAFGLSQDQQTHTHAWRLAQSHTQGEFNWSSAPACMTTARISSACPPS